MDAGVDDTLMPSARRATFEPLRLPSLRVIDAGLEAIAA
jgi:hypothetical protein